MLSSTHQKALLANPPSRMTTSTELFEKIAAAPFARAISAIGLPAASPKAKRAKDSGHRSHGEALAERELCDGIFLLLFGQFCFLAHSGPATHGDAGQTGDDSGDDGLPAWGRQNLGDLSGRYRRAQGCQLPCKTPEQPRSPAQAQVTYRQTESKITRAPRGVQREDIIPGVGGAG